MNARVVNALLVLLSILVGLLALEGVARLLPDSIFKYGAIYKGDPLLGVPLTSTDVRKDFPEIIKPENVFRIVVLGDSHLANVPEELSYPKVLEALLNKADLKGQKVEVHRAAAPGHSHYQYLLTLRDRLKQYQPDLVIVGFYIGNDFLDLYRNDDRPNLSFDGRQFVHNAPKFFKFQDPNNSAPFESSKVLNLAHMLARASIGFQLDRASILWEAGRQSGEGYLPGTRYLYRISRGYFVNHYIFRQSMNQTLFLMEFPKEKAEIDRINRKVTELMKEVATSNNMKLLYIPSPTKLQIEPESDPVVIEKTFALANFDRSMLTFEDELAESFVSMLNDFNIEAVRVEGKLREAAKARAMFDDTYHINAAAHAVIGEALQEKVKPMVLNAAQRKLNR